MGGTTKQMAKDAASGERDNQKTAKGGDTACPKKTGPAAGKGSLGNKATKGAFLKK
jgi:hypothetical protein